MRLLVGPHGAAVVMDDLVSGKAAEALTVP
jgi:hypothetical protein